MLVHSILTHSICIITMVYYIKAFSSTIADTINNNIVCLNINSANYNIFYLYN